MKPYQYEETIKVTATVWADSKYDAQDRVAYAVQIALSKMPSLNKIDQNIKDDLFNTIKIEVTE